MWQPMPQPKVALIWMFRDSTRCGRVMHPIVEPTAHQSGYYCSLAARSTAASFTWGMKYASHESCELRSGRTALHT